MRRFFTNWSREVKLEGRSLGFYDEESFRGRNKAIWVGVVLALLGLFLLPLVHEVGALPIVAGVILILTALTMVQPNARGAREAARWKSLRAYLKRRRYEDASLQDRLFIFGVLFGLSKGAIEELGRLVTADAAVAVMPWYHPVHADHEMAGVGFGGSFSTAVSTVNSAMSSSTGAGGGASGGGGGGAGGGGGGAG